MLESLVPSAVCLLQALHFCLVLGLLCGLGFLAGSRRPEIALITGWGVSCLAAVVFGCLFHADLELVAYGLGALGLLGLARQCVYVRRIEWGVVPHVIILGVPLCVILLTFHTTAYDDFAFWGPNLVALCEARHFPSLLHPLSASFMPGYPRGVALIGLATYLFMPDAHPAGLIRLLATGPWWNVTLILATSAALGSVIRTRLAAVWARPAAILPWGIAGLAILLQTFLCPGFIPKMTLSNMGDSASASGFAMLIALLFALFSTSSEAVRNRICRELALVGCAVVFVRQDNLGIIAILPVIIILLGASRPLAWLRLGAKTLAVCLPAIMVHLLWGHYVAHNIAGPQHNLIPFAQWHWVAFFHGTLHAVLKVLLAKGAYTLLAFGFLLVLIRVYRGGWRPPVAEQHLLLVITCFVFWNAFFIMFAYLATNFSLYDVKTAITFWRFLSQTGAAETMALACLIPVPAFIWFFDRRICLALALIASLVPVVILPTRWGFRYDLHSPVPDFLNLGEQVASVLPPDANIRLYDVSDNSGFAAWVVKFGLLDLAGATSHAIVAFSPPDFTPGAAPAGDYLLVTTGARALPVTAGLILQPWHGYVLKPDSGGYQAVMARPIPHYR